MVILLGILGLIGLLLLVAVYGFYQIKIKPAPLKQSAGRVYLTLLGKGGAGHTAPDLTDTIILAVLNTTNGQIKLISLPRDLWDDQLQIKINSAYYYSKQAGGQGLTGALDEVSKMTNQPADYGVVVDFNLFKQVIDDLGGVWVNVERGFDDYRYPIPGRENAYPIESRYQHISFQAGGQWMSGERALMFVRSRHAQGEEGTDFARSRRQQLVIRAIISRLANQSGYLLIHPTKTYHMIQNWLGLIETNLTPAQMVKLGLLMSRHYLTGRLSLQSLSFDKDSPEIKPARVQLGGDNIWVLKPDLELLHQTIQRFIDSDQVTSVPISSPKTALFKLPLLNKLKI